MKIILKPFGILVLVIMVFMLAGFAFFTKRPVHGSSASFVPLATNQAQTVSEAKMPLDVIYDGTLKNGWENFSWSKNNFNDSSLGGGKNAIRVVTEKFDALYFHHSSMETTGYDRISLRINGGPSGGQYLRLFGICDVNGKSDPGKEYPIPTLKPNEWKTITVSLSDLGIQGKPNFVGFWIQGSQQEKAPPYYVDNVYILRPGQTVPEN